LCVNKTSEIESLSIMVNPRDVADASRNKTNEILTVYLLNLLGFIP